MSNLIPFQFEDKSIRVVTDENGAPLFVGKDICLALGYVDPSTAMRSHCRGVQKLHPIPDALGRVQGARVLTEGDMFRLVVNSTLPSAEAFERLVFEEILPSIRKTGVYAVKQQDTPSAIAAVHIKAELDMAALFGVPLHLSQVEAVKTVKLELGYDASRFLLLAPAQTDIPKDEMRLEPTELGRMFGISAISINRLLEGAGLQKKSIEGWEPTGEGQLYASTHQWKSGTKTGYNLKWNVLRVRRIVEESRTKALS